VVTVIVDLHNHSSASDGELSPEDLLQRAQGLGVELMALTDHDTIDGYLALRQSASATAPTLQLIPGVELSCVWSKMLIHVVGLGFDADNESLRQALLGQQQARRQRAQLIAAKLEKYGFSGGYDYACDLAGESQIGRPHFAQFLLDKGYVSSLNQAYKKYLGAGKAGDVKLTWPAMASAIDWIVRAGGVAVLAHPLHYKITATKMRALLGDFKAGGGRAIEVICGQQNKDRTQYLSQLATQFELMGSVGSDFHRPGSPWSELGKAGPLPRACVPVWSQFTASLGS